MSTRIFKQTGHGYMSDAVSVIAKIDGNIVYSGAIPATAEPLPVLPDPDFNITDTLFTWEMDREYAGQATMEIEVTGGTLLLTSTFADYVNPADPSEFGSFYSYQDGEHLINDPLENETIDGILQPEDRSIGDLYGQWWWRIGDGSVFTATVNINAGVVAPQWNDSQTYPNNSVVQNSGVIYQSIKSVPVNIDISDGEYWLQVYPVPV